MGSRGTGAFCWACTLEQQSAASAQHSTAGAHYCSAVAMPQAVKAVYSLLQLAMLWRLQTTAGSPGALSQHKQLAVGPLEVMNLLWRNDPLLLSSMCGAVRQETGGGAEGCTGQAQRHAPIRVAWPGCQASMRHPQLLHPLACRLSGSLSRFRDEQRSEALLEVDEGAADSWPELRVAKAASSSSWRF